MNREMVKFQLSSKKVMLFFVALGLLGAGVAGGLYFYSRNKKAPDIISPVMNGDEVLSGSIKEKLLEDVWGLKVFYPAELQVEAATGAGELTRYNFTHPKHEGLLTIYTFQTNAASVEEWLENDEESATAASVIDTTIGGRPGKKMLFVEPPIQRQRAVTVDTWQVFVFDLYPSAGEEDYWNGIYNKILAKYQFLPFEDEAVVEEASTGTGEAAVEEPLTEEVIEYPLEIIE